MTRPEPTKPVKLGVLSANADAHTTRDSLAATASLAAVHRNPLRRRSWPTLELPECTVPVTTFWKPARRSGTPHGRRRFQVAWRRRAGVRPWC